MNIIIKLIRHRNHGGYKSVMTSYARAVQLIQLIQPSRMSNNLYLQPLSCYMYNNYGKVALRHNYFGKGGRDLKHIIA